MGKKRVVQAGPSSPQMLRSTRLAAVDEAGPSSPPVRRNVRTGIVGAISSSPPPHERRSMRANDQIARTLDVGRYHDRDVVFEVTVGDRLFRENNVLDRLLQQGWGPIFEGNFRANAHDVRFFYSKIVNARLNPLGFDISYGDMVRPISLEDIANILGVPLGTVYIPIDTKNLNTSAHRSELSRSLCGHLVEWRRDSSFRNREMISIYRMLHYIFIHNLYPRWGNSTEVSVYHAETMYQIGRGENVCLPSIILYHIVKAVTARRGNLCLPFGRLICKIARHNGFTTSVGPSHPVRVVTEDTLNRMQCGPRQEARRLEEFGDEIAEDEEEKEGNEEDEVEEEEEGDDTGDVRNARLVLDERLGAIEASISELKKDQAYLKRKMKRMHRMIKTVLCCVQKEGVPPPSPDSVSQ